MKENLARVKPFSWILACVWIVFSIGSFIILPKFYIIYQELNGPNRALPFLTQIVFLLAPFGWPVLTCIMVFLLIYRDICGKSLIFPNWAALLVLIAFGFIVVIALFLPLVVTLTRSQAV